MSDEQEKTIYFGKHKGVHLSQAPSGYLQWAVNNIDPVPLPKYRFHEDGTPMTIEEVKAMEERMRNFISAIEDELQERSENG